MNDVVREYTEAIFALSCEEGANEKYLDALHLANDVFSKNGEYTDLLLSPSIPLDERRALIEEAFSGYLPECVLSFVKLLCERGHIGHFGECVAEFERMYKELGRECEVKVVSAVELTDDEKNGLTRKLEKLIGKRIDAEYVLDSALIGGMIVYANGKVIDGSIKGRLNDVKDVID